MDLQLFSINYKPTGLTYSIVIKIRKNGIEISFELKPFYDELKEEGNTLRLGAVYIANLPTDK